MFFSLFLHVQSSKREPISCPQCGHVCNAFDDVQAPLTSSYAVELAHLLAEAPSPSPRRTRPFNKYVLDFLDIKAEQGEDSDRHGSPSC